MKQPIRSWLHQLVADMLVLFVLLLISHEGSLMASLVWHGRFFDSDVQEVEKAAWACQPSMELHKMISSRAIGEYLMGAHACWPIVLVASMLMLRSPTDDEAHAITSGVL